MKTLVKVISISFLGLSLASFVVSLYSSTQPCPTGGMFSLCPMGQQLIVGIVCAFISGVVAFASLDTVTSTPEATSDK